MICLDGAGSIQYTPPMRLDGSKSSIANLGYIDQLFWIVVGRSVNPLEICYKQDLN